MQSKNFFITLLLILLSCTSLTAYSNTFECHFNHYSTEDGLPQYTIMDILQDRKGFMWFGTWVGLSKFDGYHFKNYKTLPGDEYYMKSNRIQQLYEDAFGRIWMKTYDDDIHCLNPSTGKYWGLQSIPEKELTPTVPKNIFIQKSGKVWLSLKSNGAVLVKDSLNNYAIFNTNNSGLKGETVNNIIEDKNDNTWLLTNNGLSLLKKNTSGIETYFYENTESIKERQNFYSALEDSGYILFGSQKGRIWMYNKTNAKFSLIQLPTNANIQHIINAGPTTKIYITDNDGFIISNPNNTFSKFNTTNLSTLNSNSIESVFLINSNQLWFDTNKLGIYKFDINTKKLKHYIVDTYDLNAFYFPPRTMVFKDIEGRIWVQPRGGGFSVYNPRTDEIDPFYNSKKTGEWRFSNLIHSACSDKQGNLWLCTRSHGLEKIVFEKNIFSHIQIDKDTKSSSKNDVRCIYEDKKGRIWVATKDAKLSIYDNSGKQIGYLSRNGQITTKETLFNGMVYSMLEDKSGNIWIGTKGKGLFRLNNGKLVNYAYNESNIYSLSDNSIYSIYEDTRHNIWVGTYGGGLNLLQILPDGNIRFINHRNNLKNYPIGNANRVRFITENKNKKIFVGTTAGLIVFPSKFDSPDNLQFKKFSTQKNDYNCLSNNDIHGVCITHNNEVYIATFGGGINKITGWDKDGYPTGFKTLSVKDGLPSDVTLAIVEDKHNMLWITNENNLSKYDPEKNIFENFSEIKRLMITNNFSEASSCKLKSDAIMFGYSNGIVHFSPDNIINNTYKPYIALTNLQIFNKKVEPGEKESPLKEDINVIEKLTLTHKQNFITIEYAALDYTDSDNILYAYKLEGFDNQWNYVQQQRMANFTNLPHGKYVFRVRSTNSKGIWTDNERVLTIEVLPSFWESGWGILLYIILGFGVVLFSVRILSTIYQLRGNVELERKMSDMKLRFFTDISHEIRTPLTMITAPVEHLIEDDKTPDYIKKQLKTISQNTNRMLRLVNQILDFRKIQFLHLKVQETDVTDFVTGISENFNDIAIEKHITLKIRNNAENDTIWVDQDCFEKIIMNLLSNAFKYSYPGTSITVLIFSDDKTVSVQVTDQGAGIPKDKIKNLFVRFASFNNDKSKPSTGIGLSMIKELADKHAAKVNVDTTEGKGSTFTVTFLKGIAHFDNTVEILVAEKASVFTSDNQTIETAPSLLQNADEKDTANRKSVILLVEDDVDLRQFIRSILEDEYHIIESEDGMDGWIKAQKHCPDFIVSDIMMPHMDGVELLQKIKSTLITSHIPVILLTAKTTIESKLEGLSYGADDYITKPFSVPYFKARIANLIHQRRQLQELFRQSINSETSSSAIEFSPQPFTFSSQDDAMMKKVLGLIEENMDNTEFSVEELGKNLMMSRSVFFKKIKSLTGLAPVEFIRDMKMKRAAQILLSGEYMVKEVSYMVGISDTKYFAKCFKTKYGVTPAEYKSRKGQID